MATEDERYFIVYNGEIYNFIELQEELRLLGYHFRSNTDTEVVLCAYIEWKEKCLDRFNGMWAFAIYDRYEKRLFLSRDRFGVKPFFYAKIKDGIAFASEMKALVPVLPTVTPNYSILKDINQYFNYESTEMCVLSEIRMPFLDYRLVQLVFSISWKAKLHGGYSKSIVRDALKDIMPKGIVERMVI